MQASGLRLPSWYNYLAFLCTTVFLYPKSEQAAAARRFVKSAEPCYIQGPGLSDCPKKDHYTDEKQQQQKNPSDPGIPNIMGQNFRMLKRNRRK
jgi:hypothetical protein